MNKSEHLVLHAWAHLSNMKTARLYESIDKDPRCPFCHEPLKMGLAKKDKSLLWACPNHHAYGATQTILIKRDY